MRKIISLTLLLPLLLSCGHGGYRATLNHSLTSDQMRVCMLLKAGLSEGDILLLMDADNKRISRLKAQANKKLFGEENAKTLRNNLNLKK